LLTITKKIRRAKAETTVPTRVRLMTCKSLSGLGKKNAMKKKGNCICPETQTHQKTGTWGDSNPF